MFGKKSYFFSPPPLRNLRGSDPSYAKLDITNLSDLDVREALDEADQLLLHGHPEVGGWGGRGRGRNGPVWRKENWLPLV